MTPATSTLTHSALTTTLAFCAVPLMATSDVRFAEVARLCQNKPTIVKTSPPPPVPTASNQSRRMTAMKTAKTIAPTPTRMNSVAGPKLDAPRSPCEPLSASVGGSSMQLPQSEQYASRTGGSTAAQWGQVRRMNTLLRSETLPRYAPFVNLRPTPVPHRGIG